MDSSNKSEIILLMETVGLMGPDLGSEMFSQTNPDTIDPFGNIPCSADSILTWASMGGRWNQVSTPWGCLDVVWVCAEQSYTLRYFHVAAFSEWLP